MSARARHRPWFGPHPFGALVVAIERYERWAERQRRAGDHSIACTWTFYDQDALSIVWSLESSITVSSD